jgi:hypothetical protein
MVSSFSRENAIISLVTTTRRFFQTLFAQYFRLFLVSRSTSHELRLKYPSKSVPNTTSNSRTSSGGRFSKNFSVPCSVVASADSWFRWRLAMMTAAMSSSVACYLYGLRSSRRTHSQCIYVSDACSEDGHPPHMQLLTHSDITYYNIIIL